MKSPGNPSASDSSSSPNFARSAALAGKVGSDHKVNSGSSGGRGILIALDRSLKSINEKLHVVAAFALFGLAILILIDVLARGAFSSPIAGTAEIVSNAIVVIAFLQLAHSIRCGGFLRVEMLDDVLPTTVRKALFIVACALGAVLFAAVAYSSWDGMVEAWRIGEFDGVAGSLKVPTAPIRTVVVAASVLAAINFVVVLLRTICFGDIETASEAA
ncbi:TRAP-type C4-dicarboxylate transport system, small permease component [Variovorax sp. PBS-H4]|uniref:TRAP transporter small permease n=1 Tax=Variovorax sp. PBS-H4 TaxID=434008 RepID=UPI001317DFA8|nr:TRAP transporter small permease subunit [Variovorax sp. PBS-H4]VTU34321.1 TRAP-type C4-dicarboxylate transport system, small permease component [Variovorax sp. PBS-H4]